MVISGSRNQRLDFGSLHCAGDCKLVVEVVEWHTWCCGMDCGNFRKQESKARL